MINIIYAVLFLIVNSFLFTQQSGFIPNRILFCLNKNIETLSIERKSDGNFITNNEALNEYFGTLQISQLERWLRGANEFEHDGDIYLNRIFRLTLDSRSNVTIDKVKESFESFNFIHSVTYEAFDFLNKTAIQINRPGGFSELFAVSLSNVPTNLVVTNVSDNSINPNYPVVGFFNVSSVHGMGNTLDDEEIEKIELYNREW